MNTFVSNLVSLVIFPSLVVTWFLYVTYRSLVGVLSDRLIDTKWVAPVVLGLGLYFLGHPRYPALVPLINASTPWLFAVGGAYVTLGLISLTYSHFQHFSRGEAWLGAVLGVVIAVLAANGFEVGTVVRLVGASDFEASLYLSLPLSLMFPLGYEYHHYRKRPVPFSLLAFTSYGLVLATSITLTERVRGPVALVFIAFGCIGVLLGVPLYVLGATLASSPDER